MLLDKVKRLGRAAALVTTAAACLAGLTAGTAAAAPQGQAVAVNAVNAVPPVLNCDGRSEEFSLGEDGALWHRWQVSDGGPWSGWYSLGGSFIYDIAIALNADCRLEVFAISTGHAMHHIWQLSPSGAAGWSGWGSLGGYLTSSPAVGYLSGGRVEVRAWGPDGVLHRIAQTAWASGPWTGWY